MLNFKIKEEDAEKFGNLMSMLVLVIGAYLMYNNRFPNPMFLVGLGFAAMALHEIVD